MSQRCPNKVLRRARKSQDMSNNGLEENVLTFIFWFLGVICPFQKIGRGAAVTMETFRQALSRRKASV